MKNDNRMNDIAESASPNLDAPTLSSVKRPALASSKTSLRSSVAACKSNELIRCT
jgi:hypothetical protein